MKKKIGSTDYVPGTPESAAETVNKYGTYNVQDTADTENAFPKIAHGLPKKRHRKSDK